MLLFLSLSLQLLYLLFCLFLFLSECLLCCELYSVQVLLSHKFIPSFLFVWSFSFLFISSLSQCAFSSVKFSFQLFVLFPAFCLWYIDKCRAILKVMFLGIISIFWSYGDLFYVPACIDCGVMWLPSFNFTSCLQVTFILYKNVITQFLFVSEKYFIIKKLKILFYNTNLIYIYNILGF